MEESSYTLNDLILFVFSRGMMFHEQFVWLLIYRLTEIITPLHLAGRSFGLIHPKNVYFTSGRTEIRSSQTLNPDAFFTPPERVDSPFADVFYLGRTIQFVIAGYEDCYSYSLNKLVKWLLLSESTKRPTVSGIMTYIHNTFTEERLNDMFLTQSNYTTLYQAYTIEMENYNERMRQEKVLLEKKFHKLLDMEYQFMYRTQKFHSTNKRDQ